MTQCADGGNIPACRCALAKLDAAPDYKKARLISDWANTGSLGKKSQKLVAEATVDCVIAP